MCAGKFFGIKKQNANEMLKKISKMDFIIQWIIIMSGRLRRLGRIHSSESNESLMFPFENLLPVWGAVIKKYLQVKLGFHPPGLPHFPGVASTNHAPSPTYLNTRNLSSLRLLSCDCFLLAFYSPPYSQGPCLRVWMQFFRRIK